MADEEPIIEWDIKPSIRDNAVHHITADGVTTVRTADVTPDQPDWGVVTPDGTYYGPATMYEVADSTKTPWGIFRHSAGQTTLLEQQHNIQRRLPLSALRVEDYLERE